MKIRKGLVSNSSTTSFTVFGVSFESLADANKKLGMSLYDYAQQHSLSVEYGEWRNGNVYLGLSLFDDLKDDETKMQFMDRARERLPESLRQKASWHSESFRDG